MKFGTENKEMLPAFALAYARKQGADMPVPVFGILDGKAKHALQNGLEWCYFDHSYFKRGWDNGHFRCIRNGLHLTRILKKPADRLEYWGVKIEPWRKTGRKVVVIPPTAAQKDVLGCTEWLDNTLSRISNSTDRPLAVKHSKTIPLREFLSDAWAVVTFASVAGVEAALMGVPVFSTSNCPSWPVNAGYLEDIENPEYSDARHEWARSLSYASWHVSEMKRIKWDQYHYEVL